MRKSLIAPLAFAGLVLALLAEQQAYAWSDTVGWMPDLAAGLGLLAAGIALLATARTRVPGLLLAGASFAWFVPDFAAVAPTDTRWLLERLSYLHRGPLLALALTLPTGRPRTRADRVAISTAWFTAILWPVWSSPTAALFAAAAFVAAAALRLERAETWTERSGARYGLLAAAILAGVIAAGAVDRLTGARGATDTLVVCYAVGILLTAAVLYAGARLFLPDVLAERAVLLERRGARLRDVLGELLGDPSFEVGFGGVDELLVTEDGTSFAPARATELTPVVAGDRQLALVAHAETTLADEQTRDAVVSAVGLSAERVRLQRELDGQVAAVAASRTRLAVAEDDERRRLAARLERSVDAVLVEVGSLIDRARRSGDSSEALRRAQLRLAEIHPELDRLIAGLTVADETELQRALHRLAVTVPFAVRLELDPPPLAAAAASALWFVCSESLANAAKHAAPDSVVITLGSAGDAARLEVRDDGRGGADPGGSGLAGLADRVAAVGGRLSVDSPPGAGTRVVALVPYPGG